MISSFYHHKNEKDSLAHPCTYLKLRGYWRIISCKLMHYAWHWKPYESCMRTVSKGVREPWCVFQSFSDQNLTRKPQILSYVPPHKEMWKETFAQLHVWDSVDIIFITVYKGSNDKKILKRFIDGMTCFLKAVTENFDKTFKHRQTRCEISIYCHWWKQLVKLK